MIDAAELQAALGLETSDFDLNRDGKLSPRQADEIRLCASWLLRDPALRAGAPRDPDKNPIRRLAQVDEDPVVARGLSATRDGADFSPAVRENPQRRSATGEAKSVASRRGSGRASAGKEAGSDRRVHPHYEVVADRKLDPEQTSTCWRLRFGWRRAAPSTPSVRVSGFGSSSSRRRRRKPEQPPRSPGSTSSYS
jgi:hypothetical protein